MKWFHCVNCFLYKASYPSKVTMYIVTTLALLHVFEVYEDIHKIYNGYPTCTSKKVNRNLPKTDKVRKSGSVRSPDPGPPPPEMPCCRELEPEVLPTCGPEPPRVRSCPPPPSCQQRPPPSCGGEPPKVEPPKKKKSGKKKKSSSEGSKTSKTGTKKKKTKPKNEKVDK